MDQVLDMKERVQRAEQRMERIRNKPITRLTAREIGMLTTQEQRWVWDYRHWLKSREAK